MAHNPLRLEGLSQVALAISVLLAAGRTAAAQTQDWTLIWSDEFTGTAGAAPNPANWTLQQGLTPDGAQSYNCLYGQTTNGCNPAEPNVSLDGNGNLAIVARAAAAAPNGVTTGRLFTTNSNNTTDLFSTQYGRIEAGITLPAGSGNQGVWPAFWMLGTNIPAVNWPSCGELDIMEYVGAANETQIYSTLHGQAYANEGLGVRDTMSGGWSGYHIFGAIWSPNQVSFYVDDINNIYGTISTTDIMADQAWVNGGLAAWPFNNPMFIIFDLNMGGPFPGNVSSATTYPQTLLVDYVRVYKAAAPAPPTGLTATAISQSQVALNWTGSTSSDVTYNIYRSQVSGVAPQSQAQPNAAVLPQINQTLIANNITATTYTDANLSPGQTYYYTVTGSGEYSGESAAPQVKVAMPATGVGANGGAIYVSAAGYSGTGPYIVNSLVSGGFTNAFTATINTAGVTNPAPQDVYHTERWGPQSWTIAHLTPNGSYNVRMHFAESAWTAAGQREFNVLVNGEQVLTNFDIFATAGAQNKVVTQTINTVADRNGMILLQLAPGAADQPEIRALDVTPSTGGTAFGEAPGTTGYVAIDSGGPVEGAFEADLDAGNFGLPANTITAGGGTNTTTQTISTSGVTNPAPEAVYQTERYGAFSYIFTGLVANSTYTIRLHLAEGVADYNAAGLREFNVVVNGNQVLTNYDIFANAGAIDQAVIPQVTGTSDEHGILSLQFTPGYDDLPSVRGIEITQSSTPPPVTATPTFSPAGGTYTSALTVTISDATAGAAVHYTTNGTTPTTSSALYSGPITVSASETLEAIAIASGNSSSAVATAAYTISASGGTDVLDINPGGTAAGSYVADEDFAGGAEATTTNTVSTASVTNPAPEAVYQTQRFGNFTYTLPGFTAGASYTVRLHFAETYWTAARSREFNVLINGTQVLTSFDIFAAAGGENKAVVEQFSATANAAGQLTIQFVTVKDNAAVNGIEIETAGGGTLPAAATPTFSPAGGSYTSAQTVTVGDATAGATIYYTTNGTAPTTSSALYSGPITVSSSETLKAIATASGDSTSAVATAAYTINIAMPPAATPTFSPAGGTYSSAQTVTISDATAGAAIHYTTNGTTPTTASALYSGPITVSASETLEAIATASGDSTSAVATAAYTISASGGTDVLDINAGGAAAGSYLADEDFAGGNASATAASINTSLVANPAPQAVYQTDRFGDFTYTIANLTAGSSYLVDLHFAEIYWTAAGKREFNVLINGTQVLTNFDIFAAAGGENIAIMKSFPATASTSGTITVQFTSGAADLPKVSGIEIVQPTNVAPATDLKIDTGGVASGAWLADEDYVGGAASATTAAINTSLVASPAPQAVYQTERFGDLTYTIPNLTAGTSYTVNLSFAEIYWTAAGKREFNVLINGTQVLTNFDIFAAAGGENIAILKSFTATASASGAITIQFTTGAADLPKVSGIEVAN